MTRGQFLEIISVATIKYGGNTESWIRSIGHNIDVDGHPESFHLSGEAVDVWFHTRQDAEQFKRYCGRRALHTKWNGGRPKVSQTVHVQIVPPAPSQENT